MRMLIKRNLYLYFRDRSSVFFSLLSVFIALGIYFLFLAANMERSMEGIDGLTYLLDSWFLAGALSIMSVTITLGSYGTMVEDETYNIQKDFLVSPMKRRTIALSYVFSSCIIGLIMSFIVLTLGEICIVMRGGELLPLASFLKIIGLLVISVVSSSAVMFFLAGFLHSNSSYSGASTVVGTLIGFLAGMYMPIGSLPSGVQNFVRIIPTAHAAALFRQILMEQPLETIAATMPQAAKQLQEELGVILKAGDTEITVWMSLAFMIGTAVIFFLLSLARLAKKKL